ncbi:DUF5615 family PIN-like protein [Pseudonocardia halophobica]|uniref:DUF5615 family PIN-like protein n=1 Tax=Pseudonocardia halophobica TaxID=29401 RepID=UPI003D8E9247
MRLLLDNNLSPRLCALLSHEGWDATHVRSLGLRAASDRTVLLTARTESRVLVSGHGLRRATGRRPRSGPNRWSTHQLRAAR